MKDEVNISRLLPAAIGHLAITYRARKDGLPSGDWCTDKYSDLDVYFLREDGIAWIIIPGTDSRHDWLRSNLFPFPSWIDGVPGLWRGGFAVAGTHAWRLARQCLRPSDHFIAIVGHSLGGAAVAATGALAIRDGYHDRVVALLNIAGPRSTSNVGANFLQEYYPPEVGQRVTLGVDIVPRSVMPFGWVHCLHPFFIDPKTNEATDWRARRRSYLFGLLKAIFIPGVQTTKEHKITSYLPFAIAEIRRRRLDAAQAVAVAGEVDLGTTTDHLAVLADVRRSGRA